MTDGTKAFLEPMGLTIDQAAAYSGIGIGTLRKLLKGKYIPYLTVGQRFVVRRDMLDAFMIANNQVDILHLEDVKSVHYPEPT